MSNSDLYLMSHVYIKSLLEHVAHQPQSCKSSLMYQKKEKNSDFLMIPQTHNYCRDRAQQKYKRGQFPCHNLGNEKSSVACRTWKMGYVYL